MQETHRGFDKVYQSDIVNPGLYKLPLPVSGNKERKIKTSGT